MSQHQLSEASFHQQRRSLLRKKTRAGWGIGISSAMSVSGLPYMAGAAVVSASGYEKSGDTLEDLERMMVERGIKPRSRDKLASFLTGTAEKFTLTAVLLGHDEALLLNGQWGLDLTHLNNEVLDHSGSAGANEIVNKPTSFVMDVVGYKKAQTLPATTAVGAAAAATEYATGKLGDAGANWRYQAQAGESQQAMLQRMGVRSL